jgi:dihydrofolate reductase
MKLTTMTQVTVDGVMQGNGGASDEDRRNGFERGGWAMGVADNETMTFINETYRRADAFLFGRRTYELFAGYWGAEERARAAAEDPRNHPIAAALNTKPKYLVSNTLTEPRWADTTVLCYLRVAGWSLCLSERRSRRDFQHAAKAGAHRSAVRCAHGAWHRCAPRSATILNPKRSATAGDERPHGGPATQRRAAAAPNVTHRPRCDSRSISKRLCAYCASAARSAQTSSFIEKALCRAFRGMGGTCRCANHTLFQAQTLDLV